MSDDTLRLHVADVGEIVDQPTLIQLLHHNGSPTALQREVHNLPTSDFGGGVTTHGRADHIEFETKHFVGSVPIQRDGRGVHVRSSKGRVRLKGTDVEVEDIVIEADAIYDKAHDIEQRESAGAAARDAWARSRGVETAMRL